jgi:antitoxin ParD1/3/4
LAQLSKIDSLGGIQINRWSHPMPSSYVIGDHFEMFIKAQIRQGRYATASEVVRDALRALENREKLSALKLTALRGEIQRGADSGAGVPAKAAFAAVRKRIAQSAATSGKQ